MTDEFFNYFKHFLTLIYCFKQVVYEKMKVKLLEGRKSDFSEK